METASMIEYREIRDALIADVKTALWADPWTRRWIVFRPSAPGVRGSLATVTESEDPPEGFTVADARNIPVNLDDTQRARWIDTITRRLPILDPSRG